jgi:thiamine biosynthesis lipoprotein
MVAGGGEVALLRHARRRLFDLERRWSRFLPTSEVSRLNRRTGRPVVVSPDTFGLLERAVDAWRLTAGRFDPTVLGAVLGAGYDKDFALLAGGLAGQPAARRRLATGCAGIRLDRAVSTVWLPPGVGFDPGGIGKGLAADVVADELVGAGAHGALVNVGGDVRVRGAGPVDGQWVVGVEHPLAPGEELVRFALTDGAVATSSPLRRRWSRGDAVLHHLIDPSTEAPATTNLASVTVVAGAGWWAEALATALCIDSMPDSIGPRPDASVVLVGMDGAVVASPELGAVAA